MTHVRTHGWPRPFKARPWPEIAAFLAEMGARYPSFQHMSDVAESVIASGSTELLAGTTSMHDLLVLPTPVSPPPYAVVAVRAPTSLHEPSAPGLVLVEHLSVTGRHEHIERPVSEAVPLFWRFVAEKFGVLPASPPERA